MLVVLAALLMFGVGWLRHRALVLAYSPRSPHAVLIVLVVGTVWLACGAAALSLLD